MAEKMKKKPETKKPNVYLIKEKGKLLEGFDWNNQINTRPIRIFSTYKAALKNAKEAMEDRAGKYDAKISTAYIDEPWNVKLYRVIHWGDEY